MDALLTPDQFATRVVGLPWRKWHADFDACDCFGLVVLWHRHVVGRELGPVPQTDIATGFNRADGWVECRPEAGATCWMAWRDGAPTHCGVLIAGDVMLHAEGSAERAGSVRVSSLRFIQRIYGDVRFYRHQPC